ncbi:MAG: hypothetical protein KJ049_09085 [Gammaproteobacteria bacterium]|nr:hypothetical protein [Gammaproteobacteria bacterium]
MAGLSAAPVSGCGVMIARSSDQLIGLELGSCFGRKSRLSRKVLAAGAGQVAALQLRAHPVRVLFEQRPDQA